MTSGPGFDLSGVAFGRWVALSYAGGWLWNCRCSCGKYAAVDGRSLRAGRSKGCIQCHAATGPRRTHGGRGERLYTIWGRMIGRCENQNDKAFDRYGGRGIGVCGEWRSSFSEFRAWAIGSGYKPSLTIDRYPDNDGNYEPSNCRWATYTQQNRNRRDNKPITYQGERLLISEFAERFGLPADIVKNRITRYGWPIGLALSTPVGQRGQRHHIHR